MDRGAWQGTFHRVTNSQTQLKHARTEDIRIISRSSAPLAYLYPVICLCL